MRKRNPFSPFEADIRDDIEEIKKDPGYKERFKTPEIGNVQQAIDILERLRGASVYDPDSEAWQKLTSAIEFLRNEANKLSKK